MMLPSGSPGTETVTLIPARSDNYVHLLPLPSGGLAVVDPTEPHGVLNLLDGHAGQLKAILLTHHHDDHIAGAAALQATTGAAIIGNGADADRLPSLDRGVAGGERFELEGAEVDIIATPGHTLHHIAFHLPQQGWLFAGDTLFSLGCGRLFEGTALQMWESLLRLRALPADTLLYCGHEYTESNARFALSVDPDNAELQARAAEVRALRAEGHPTLPVRLGGERATNPFLRADDPRLAAAIGLEGANPEDVFAELRRRKDDFR